MPGSSEAAGGRAPTFSQRHGYQPFDTVLQIESLDERTRIDIWNLLIYKQFLDHPYPDTSGQGIWIAFLGQPRQDYTINRLAGRLDEIVISGEWHLVYDLLEFLVQRYAFNKRREYIETVNFVFALNRVGYRVIDERIAPITSSEEVSAVEAAAHSSLDVASTHIRNALAQFSAREHPNFAKCIQEAMSAAEAAANSLARKQGLTFSEALSEVQRQQGNLSLHSALVEGWKRLYGFTSDSGGIRHALKEGSVQPSLELAQYFLITCSAFVNLAAAALADAGA